MTFRLFLFLLATLFVQSKSDAQILLENAQKNNNPFLEVSGNVKNIIASSYDLPESKLKFNESLLDFNFENPRTEYKLSYNEEGQKINGILSYKKKDKVTGELNLFEKSMDWKYANSYLTDKHLKSEDTSSVTGHEIFECEFDDEDRITKVIKFGKYSYNKSNELQKIESEEIEYIDSGKGIELFTYEDDKKKLRSDMFYNSDDELISLKQYDQKYTDVFNYTENFYTSDGKLDIVVYRLNITSHTQGFVSTSPQGEFQKGSYIKYYYTENGVLEKIKEYELQGDTNEGIPEFWKGNLKYTTTYKEKTKGEYIFQVVKTQKAGEPKKVRSKKILDLNRNTLIHFRLSKIYGDVSTYSITYYD